MRRSSPRPRTEQVARLLAEGLSQARIAQVLGISTGNVCTMVRRHEGRAARPFGERERAIRARASHEDILDAWADGLGQYDLHLLTGRSEQAIRQIVQRARRRGDARAVMKDSASRAAAARAA